MWLQCLWSGHLRWVPREGLPLEGGCQLAQLGPAARALAWHLQVTWSLGSQSDGFTGIMPRCPAEAVWHLMPRLWKSQAVTCVTFYSSSKSLRPGPTPGKGARVPPPWWGRRGPWRPYLGTQLLISGSGNWDKFRELLHPEGTCFSV